MDLLCRAILHVRQLFEDFRLLARRNEIVADIFRGGIRVDGHGIHNCCVTHVGLGIGIRFSVKGSKRIIMSKQGKSRNPHHVECVLLRFVSHRQRRKNPSRQPLYLKRHAERISRENMSHSACRASVAKGITSFTYLTASFSIGGAFSSSLSSLEVGWRWNSSSTSLPLMVVSAGVRTPSSQATLHSKSDVTSSVLPVDEVSLVLVEFSSRGTSVFLETCL